MDSGRIVHLAVNIRSAVTTSEVVEWLHNMGHTLVGMPQISKIVLLRLNLQDINVAQASQFNQISPQIACYQQVPKLRTKAGYDSIGWWWNVGLHHAFHTMPYPDYVLHYPFDIDWSIGEGNTVVTRDKLQGFLEAIKSYELIIGTFSASERIDVATPEGEHTKDRIEEGIKQKLRESLPQFNYKRPRSEFFIVERDFYYEFQRDMSPGEFSNDLTVQLLMYAHSKGKKVDEFSLGRYYVPPEDYTPKKETEQIERTAKIIEWAKNSHFG